MKNVMKRILVCGLCMSMLAGCASQKENVEPQVQSTEKSASDKRESNAALQKEKLQAKASGMKNLAALQDKYADSEDYRYTEPMFNLAKDYKFSYDVGSGYFANEQTPGFAVFCDSDLENSVNVTIDRDYDNNKVTIVPTVVFQFQDHLTKEIDYTWGDMSKFWLVQYRDTQTGDELDKPLVTVFTIARDLNTPTLKQSVGEDGYYKLSWTPVDGADYYDVYKYDDVAMGFADIQMTTDKLECTEADFNDVVKSRQDLEDMVEGTELENMQQWTMNSYLNIGYSYFVVAKTNDGKFSGMSNICNPMDIGNQIPVMVQDDFQSEYTGTDPMSLPAYVNVEMLDGSIGKYVIEYYGANAALLTDGSISISPAIRNLPIAMQSIKITGVDYDELIKSGEKLREREEQLEGKTGSTSENIDIPYVPDSQDNPQDQTQENQQTPTQDDQQSPAQDDQQSPTQENQQSPAQDNQQSPTQDNQQTPAQDNQQSPTQDNQQSPTQDNQQTPTQDNQQTPTQDNQQTPTQDNQQSPTQDNQQTPAQDNQQSPAQDNQQTPSSDDSSSVNMAGVELPQNVADTVYANSSLSEWLAINLLAHNESISLAGFNEASDSEKLGESFDEAYRQNPLCGIIDDMGYNYDTNSITVKYAQSKEDTLNMQQESIKKAKEIVGQIITDQMSDYEKEAAINKYLCDNATYNFDVIGDDGDVDQSLVDKNANSFTPYGVLVENLGVCESYAEAFHLVASEAGLPSIMVVGTLSGGGHEWNRVLLDGKWYTLDVTNNDNEIVPNSLFNLSDTAAGEILKQESVCVLSSVADQFVADDMDHEYYAVNGLAVSDTNAANDLLVKGLMENGTASVRINMDLNDAQFEELLQNVVNASNLDTIQYLIMGDVIGVTKATA